MNGCPDSDGDGVADNVDQCPNEAGEATNNGCPWPDADGDGVADKDDLCPNEAGDAANNGCPEAPKALLDFIGDENSKIFFKADSSSINEAGSALVNQLVALLNQYPNASVTIGGHASSDGSSAYNQKLSEKRANAVRDAVIAAGIAAGRVDAKGFGEDQPVDTNNTRAGRAKNRRVDFARRVDIAIN
jgi:OOP family OmpA-OmpF porin